ncbi:hypothetical protein HJ170_23630 [Vibrio parahaemolyticus]|nr:hypothetical protein [Vibrio parahaemolyticus]
MEFFKGNVFDVVMALAAIITTWSVFLIRRQIRFDHERSRREKAIELMHLWSTHPHGLSCPIVVLCKNLVDRMTLEHCEKLVAKQAVSLDENLLDELVLLRRHIQTNDLIEGYKPENIECTKLTAEESILIAQYASRYLNILEIVAASWKHHIADREMIEEEFFQILRRKRGTPLMKNYRTAMGVFPSLNELVLAIDKHEKNTFS